MKTFLFILLVAIGALRYGAISVSSIPNFDEEAGIGESLDYPLSTLLLSGPVDQLNTSPLHYIVDKVWLGLFGNSPHRHFNLNVFFRVLPILYVSLATGLAFLLCLDLCLLFGFSFRISALFGLAAGIFFQSITPVLRVAAMQDRPYALWFLLSFVHFYLFLKCRNAPSKRMAAIGIVLALTSYASLSQTLVSTVLRGFPLWKVDRKKALLCLFEFFPALAIGLWYWSHSHSLPYEASFTQPFFDQWLEAVVMGTWGMIDPVAAQLAGGWRGMPLLAPILAALFLLLPFLRSGELRRVHMYSIALLVVAVPVTLIASLVAQSLQPRYFIYLYPAFGLAHLFSVLALAAYAKDLGYRYGALLLLLWSLMQGAYRIPVMAKEVTMALNFESYPLYVSEPLKDCPENFGVFRRGIARPVALGAVDLQKLHALCLPKINRIP